MALRMTAVDVPGDGNCMFHSLSRGLHGAEARTAAELRAAAVAYMRTHLDEALYPSNNDTATARQWIEWAGFATAEAYLQALARNGTWGQSLELAALCQVLGRPIGVYTPPNTTQPRRSHEAPQQKTCRLVAQFQPNDPVARQRAPIFLLYVGSNHYMALK